MANCKPTKRKRKNSFDLSSDLSKHEIEDIDLLSEINLPINRISVYEFEWHYRLKIEGLTNVISLPRFDSLKIKSVYVLAEISNITNHKCNA